MWFLMFAQDAGTQALSEGKVAIGVIITLFAIVQGILAWILKNYADRQKAADQERQQHAEAMREHNATVLKMVEENAALERSRGQADKELAVKLAHVALTNQLLRTSIDANTKAIDKCRLANQEGAGK